MTWRGLEDGPWDVDDRGIVDVSFPGSAPHHPQPRPEPPDPSEYMDLEPSRRREPDA